MKGTEVVLRIVETLADKHAETLSKVYAKSTQGYEDTITNLRHELSLMRTMNENLAEERDRLRELVKSLRQQLKGKENEHSSCDRTE